MRQPVFLFRQLRPHPYYLVICGLNEVEDGAPYDMRLEYAQLVIEILHGRDSLAVLHAMRVYVQPRDHAGLSIVLHCYYLPWPTAEMPYVSKCPSLSAQVSRSYLSLSCFDHQFKRYQLSLTD